jgi:hypothetical protein
MPKFNWKNIAHIAVAIVGQQVPAVVRVEQDVEALMAKGQPKPSNAARLASARALVLDSLEAVEGVAGKDLLNDAEVSKAVDGVSSAIVALMNVLAAKKGG